MGDFAGEKLKYATQFFDVMAGGAFICRRDGKHEILYANEGLAHLFECDDVSNFMDFIGGVYDGMVNASQLRSIWKEVNFQINGRGKKTGHLFYHVRTRKDNVRLVEEHWSVRTAEDGRDLFYSILTARDNETGNSDFDPITGLYGKTKFHSYATIMNRNLTGKDTTEYAIAYLNFVNFKLLNINQGVAEGDACLKTIADILAQVFDKAFLARISDDHFAIFTEYEGVFDKLEECGRIFRDSYGNRYHIVGKSGIYKFVPNAGFDVEAALSFAKVACDYIKYDSKIDRVEYSDSLARKVKIAEYVIQTIDKALEKEWIKVYYQPVVRSLTHELCGVESLVRWSDVEMGFLMPDQIVGILEDHRQIHKLDCYVVEKVCQCIHDRVQKGLPVVPVSVNFSRQDFLNCDMLKVVEDTLKKYDVPRDYVHIEITESMIVSDEELMRDVIERFRRTGYEIWMDDFGSGYSSLTLLKDYQFDMLKLDMRFLTPFTEKSKDIIRSTITMAKDLGIQTLAEGVETQEHLDFLTEVGCGKIQGYYYGKPEPVEKLYEHLAEKKISIEKRKWRHFYEVASFHVRATDVPLEVVEDDGKNLRTLFMNKAYREQIKMEGVSLEEMDGLIYHTGSPLMIKYREFAEQMKQSGKQEVFYYTYNRNYLCFRGQALVCQDGHAIIKGSIMNLTMEQDNEEVKERLDSKLRVLNLMFRVILLADLKNQTLRPLLGTSPNMKEQPPVMLDIKANNAYFAEQNIFPTERNRYREFMDFSTAKERVEHSPFGYVSDIFRIKQQDGNYRAAEVTLMMIPGTDGNEYLYCVKPYKEAVDEENDGVNCILHGGDEKDLSLLLLDHFLWNADIKFYWKDLEGKFLGASQAFLDYFGIRSLKELVGKTEEEMNWHVNEAPVMEEDKAVLTRGARIRDSIGQCISGGKIRNVVSYKMPLYKNDKIIGLVGYFFDGDSDLLTAQGKLRERNVDRVTGLMNAHAFIDAMIDYARQYNENGRNYGLIMIRNVKWWRIMETYGEELANASLRAMGECIGKIVGNGGVAARTKEAIFAILFRTDDRRELTEKAKLLEEALSEINAVQGNPVTMRVITAIRLRSDEGMTDEIIYEQALRDVSEREE